MLKMRLGRGACLCLALIILQSPGSAHAQIGKQREAHSFFLNALPRGGASYNKLDFSEYQGADCKSQIVFSGKSLVLDWSEVTDVSQTRVAGAPDWDWEYVVDLVAKESGKVTNLSIRFKSEDIAKRIAKASEELVRTCDPLKGSAF